MTSSFYFSSEAPKNILDPDGDKSDITVSADGSVLTIDPSVVTFAKIQDIPSGTILGRSTAGSGIVELISLGSGLELVDGVLQVIDAPVISNPPPVNTTAPTLIGTIIEGQSLSVTNGVWLNSPNTYTYQWLRNGLDIVGSTTNTYTLTATDVGTSISCLVNATNSGGTTGRVSNSLGPIISGIPLNRTLPVLTGSSVEGGQITTSLGTWTNTPTSYTYTWIRNGVPQIIPNSQTYTLGSADIGTTIGCSVTATNAFGSSSPAVASNTIGPITAIPALGSFDIELISGGSVQLITGGNLELLGQSLELIGGGLIELIGGGTIDLGAAAPPPTVPSTGILLNGSPLLISGQYITIIGN